MEAEIIIICGILTLMLISYLGGYHHQKKEHKCKEKIHKVFFEDGILVKETFK